MNKEKCVKVALDKPVKLNDKWYNPPRTLKVEASIASEIVLAKAGHFTDPDEAVDVNTNKPVSSLSVEERDSLVSILCDIDGISTDLAEKLVDAGLKSIVDVYESDMSTLTDIKGIGEKLVKTIQASAGDLIDDE